MVSQVNSMEHLKKKIIEVPSNLFQKIEEEASHPNSFYEVSVTPPSPLSAFLPCLEAKEWLDSSVLISHLSGPGGRAAVGCILGFQEGGCWVLRTYLAFLQRWVTFWGLASTGVGLKGFPYPSTLL